MYGILGEDESDVLTLRVLLQRIKCDPHLQVRKRGYDGCGELLAKGAKQLDLFKSLGCTAFIICYDSDGHDPNERRREVQSRIIARSSIDTKKGCIVVPVQEIEAWILADLPCKRRVNSAAPVGRIVQRGVKG